MPDSTDDRTPQHPAPDSSKDAGPVTKPNEPDKVLDEKKKLSTSGLSWDETKPKPNENWNRASEMGEAD